MSRWLIPIAVFALTCLVAVVFFPILSFEFIHYDVGPQVLLNPHVQSLTFENVKHILTSKCVTSYYPVRSLSHALDYQLWGPNPLGFKLSNCLFHLANVLLVFWLIVRLFAHQTSSDRCSQAPRDVVMAAFAAGLFAVHPLVVEPVSWVGGREELLMTLGALSCFHFHLAARWLNDDANRRRAWMFHSAAAFFCAFACFSNAVGAVTPALVTAWDLLTLGRPKLGKILRGTAMLWVIGAAAVASKMLGADPETLADDMEIGLLERLPLILNVYWLNVRSIAWPTNLSIFYWRIYPEQIRLLDMILGASVLCLTFLILGIIRKQKTVLFGLLWFGLALGPCSQIVAHHVHRADRFLYLPLVGLVIAMSMGLGPVCRRLKTGVALRAVGSLGVVILLSLTLRSADQVQTWRDSITMWQNCVEVCPNNTYAHKRLAVHLAKQGDSRQATIHEMKALELDFANNHRALCDRAEQLATLPDMQLHDCRLAVQLAQRACELTEWEDPKCLRILAATYCAMADVEPDDQQYFHLAVPLVQRACELTQWEDPKCLRALAATCCALANAQSDNRQFVEAMENYRKAITVDAEYDWALFDLSILLSSCADSRLRDPEEAVRLARRGCDVTTELDSHKLSILSMAYLEAGRVDDAVAAAEEAARLAAAAGHDQLAADIRRWAKEQGAGSGDVK